MRIAIAGATGVVGRYTSEAVAAAGHEPVALARSVGVDIYRGDGLAGALAGVDAVIDATNAGSTEERPATEFFVQATANLSRMGAAAGVHRLVVLSIVGIDGVPTGYYAAKLAHERAAVAGPLPVTVVRSTQFHEFAAQMIRWNRQGPVAQIPDLRVQTVAARTVGRVLVEVAVASPGPRAPDLAGPAAEDLVVLARRFADRFDVGVRIVPVTATVPAGALLAGTAARIEGPSFEEWLDSEDAARLAREL